MSADSAPIIEINSSLTTEDIQQAKADALAQLLRDTQYAPDVEGILTIGSWYISHWFSSEKPIWIMLLGPSGMGKTTLGIDPLVKLPQVQSLSKINEHSFISGFDEVGVLQQFTKNSNGNGILAFSDFSGVIDSDERTRKDVFAQLREIYDGHTSKQTGNKGNLTWDGKCSAIAACTNKIERYWSVNRDLGERWIVLRWRYGHRDGFMEYAFKHREQERTIASEYKQRFYDLVKPSDGLKNAIPKNRRSSEYEKLIVLQPFARFAGRCRRSVERASRGFSRDINYRGEEEGPQRIFKAIMNSCIAHCCMMRKSYIDERDIQIGIRLAIDTIPLQRRQVLAFLSRHYKKFANHDNRYEIEDLSNHLNINRHNLLSVIEELNELKLVHYHTSDSLAALNGKETELDTVQLNENVVTEEIRKYLGAMPLRILDEGTKNDRDLVTEDD